MRDCYARWSDTYFRDYYGDGAPYPPVHRKIVRKLLRDARVRRILDAGCGPASLLRHLAKDGLDVYGFDLTPEMVQAGRKVLKARGVPPNRLWTGSVLSRAAYGQRRYDAVVCIGVMPHIPEKSDGRVLRNIRGALKRNGLAVVEARNQFFSLFTLNRYSYEFFVNDLIPAKMKPKARRLRRRFRMDLPPVRKGYDEILSRTHNPLVLRDRFVRAGFKDVRLHFYHYHALPPMLERESPGTFRRASLAMEDPEDWRGYFMASAFLVTGRRS